MKILFATYPMAFHTPGGGEMQLLAYKKHLSQYGVEVTLFNPWKPQLLEHDIVHFFSCVGGSVHFCHFVNTLGIPLVVSSSLWITEQTKHLYATNEIAAQLALADKVICNSDIECKTLSMVLQLPIDKFKTIYNGYDDYFMEKPSPALFRNHFEIDSPFILNVGNIEPRKNQLPLTEVMTESFPEYKLIIIGHVRDSDYYYAIRNMAPNQVVYIGALPHDSILLRSAFQACESFVLPSTLETPGLAALEAAAQGIAPVVTSEGSAQEYFKEHAYYINPMSKESIRSGIKKSLLHNKIDSKVVAAYSWSEVIRPLVNVYRDMRKI